MKLVSDKDEVASKKNVVLRGPTINGLLQEKIEMKMHANLPRLKEKKRWYGTPLGTTAASFPNKYFPICILGLT